MKKALKKALYEICTLLTAMWLLHDALCYAGVNNPWRVACFVVLAARVFVEWERE